MQHREGPICNTPNGQILAQIATQRWLNLQHTKTSFRFLGRDRGVGTVGGGLGLGGDCVHTHSSYVINNPLGFWVGIGQWAVGTVERGLGLGNDGG